MALLAAVAIGLQAASTIMSVNAQRKADKERANAEARNASFFREQAAFAQAAGDRELEVFKRKHERLVGDQLGKIAKSSAMLSGSFVNVVAETQFLGEKEMAAIERETKFNVRMAMVRGLEADHTARQIRKNIDNRTAGLLLQGAAGMISTAASTGAFSSNSKPPVGTPTLKKVTVSNK